MDDLECNGHPLFCDCSYHENARRALASHRVELQIEAPADELGAQLVAGLERSGMTFRKGCALCGRPYGSRDGSQLCPPCAGKTRHVDCWLCKSDDHNSPDCPQLTPTDREIYRLIQQGRREIEAARRSLIAVLVQRRVKLQIAELRAHLASMPPREQLRLVLGPIGLELALLQVALEDTCAGCGFPAPECHCPTPEEIN